MNTERQVHTITQDNNNPIWNENNTPQNEKPDESKKTNISLKKELINERCNEKFFSKTNKLPNTTVGI
jgi:hypothetical protein